MPTIQPIPLEQASPDQKKVLEPIKAKLGKIPNIYATIAHSPSTLGAMLAYGAGLKKGVLSPQEIEMIALAVGEANTCDYCVAAHTVIGKMAGVSSEAALDARRGRSADPKVNALLGLCIEIVKTNGRPSPKSVEAFRKAGYGDAALVEVIAWVAYSIFTNYFNHIAETESDFPRAPEIK
jgi:uncharacterized peroxidase-related enzyme